MEHAVRLCCGESDKRHGARLSAKWKIHRKKAQEKKMSKATKESVTRAMNRVGIPGTIFYDRSVRHWYAVDTIYTPLGEEFWCRRSEGTDIFPSLNGLTTEQALGYVIDRAFCRDPEDDPKGFDEEICRLLIAVFYPSLVPAGWTDLRKARRVLRQKEVVNVSART
jgi:hypothetical protein